MSEWKQDASNRRAFRNARDEPEVPKHHPKKRYGLCKKAKGPHIISDEPLYLQNGKIKVKVCKVCGKHLEISFLGPRIFGLPGVYKINKSFTVREDE